MRPRPTTLLTGATDGIGLALARLWRARGEAALLHGRRPLAELDPEVFAAGSYLRADLAHPSGPERIEAQLAERGVERLDRVVLGAAAGLFALPHAHGEEETRRLVEVDLLAPMRLAHLLLPRLERARGRIVFVSSVTSRLPCAEYAVYGAAKAAAEGFFRALRVETRGRVAVQVLRPGAARTGLHAKSGVPPERVASPRISSAEAVARAIDRALARPPRWRTLGLGNALLGMAGRHLEPLVDRLAARRGRGRGVERA